jgi:hypothetical protein
LSAGAQGPSTRRGPCWLRCTRTGSLLHLAGLWRLQASGECKAMEGNAVGALNRLVHGTQPQSPCARASIGMLRRRAWPNGCGQSGARRVAAAVLQSATPAVRVLCPLTRATEAWLAPDSCAWQCCAGSKCCGYTPLSGRRRGTAHLPGSTKPRLVAARLVHKGSLQVADAARRAFQRGCGPCGSDNAELPTPARQRSGCASCLQQVTTSASHAYNRCVARPDSTAKFIWEGVASQPGCLQSLSRVPKR